MCSKLHNFFIYQFLYLCLIGCSNIVHLTTLTCKMTAYLLNLLFVASTFDSFGLRVLLYATITLLTNSFLTTGSFCICFSTSFSSCSLIININTAYFLVHAFLVTWFWPFQLQAYFLRIALIGPLKLSKCAKKLFTNHNSRDLSFESIYKKGLYRFKNVRPINVSYMMCTVRTYF